MWGADRPPEPGRTRGMPPRRAPERRNRPVGRPPTAGTPAAVVDRPGAAEGGRLDAGRLPRYRTAIDHAERRSPTPPGRARRVSRPHVVASRQADPRAL